MNKPAHIIRIRPALLADLDTLAATLSMSRTEVVNHLIREYTTIEAQRIRQAQAEARKHIGRTKSDD